MAKGLKEDEVAMSICVYVRPVLNMVKVRMSKASSNQKISIGTIQM